jgi:hypothetical protein
MLRIATAMAMFALSLSPALARHHVTHHQYHRHYSVAHHRGSCDGIHRCRCGSTQTAHFGLPRMYNGHNLWQAVEWTRAFPHTSAHVGAVGYQHSNASPTGHVFRVVAYAGGCRATVSDDAGTYERDICSRGAIFVDVAGGGAPTTTYSVRSRGHRGVRYHVAYAAPSTYNGPGSANFGAAL